MYRRLASDAELLMALKEGGQAADDALAQLYRDNRAVIGQLIIQNHGDQEAAKDIMQDAMIALYENVRGGRFKEQSRLSTYLFGIARLMWLNRLKRQKMIATKLEQMVYEDQHTTWPRLLEEQESLASIRLLLAQLGPSCQQVLIDNIYFGFDMKYITRKMQYGSEQVARNKKHRCLKRLKVLLQNRPDLLKLLIKN